MPRKPRVQFAGAIYHVVARGDGRQTLFHDPGHYERLTQGLADEVLRSGWNVVAFCWMPNHLHLLLKTPRPNLSSGMQHWLSGYANWYAKRNQRTGHLFQGRYKSFAVEDARYYWTLSRYIHLNPCAGSRPLVEHPRLWPYSSYPGCALKSRRCEFVDYDSLWDNWSAEFGGKNPVASYRRFVEQGLSAGVANPLKEALDDWVIGSKTFLKRIIKMAAGSSKQGDHRMVRRSSAYSLDEISQFVADAHEVERSAYVGFRSSAPGREIAALLCRQMTSSTLAEMSKYFGLEHPDSAANLVRRANKLIANSPKYKQKFEALREKLMKTENQA